MQAGHVVSAVVADHIVPRKDDYTAFRLEAARSFLLRYRHGLCEALLARWAMITVPGSSFRISAMTSCVSVKFTIILKAKELWVVAILCAANGG